MQPATNRQTRTETSCAPGAAPLIAPPNMPLRGDDPGDVGAVLAGHDADVDGRCSSGVDLDDERHPLGDGGRRVVGAEVADVAVVLVVRHRRLVGEAAVLVDVDPDPVAAVPQDAEDAVGTGRVAVTVDVVADLAAERGSRSLNTPKLERAGGRRGVGDAAGRERRTA